VRAPSLRGRGPGGGGRARVGGRARGVTLIELVVAITIVAMAAAAVLGAMSAISTRSANVMVRHQAVAIAEAYLEEILLKPVVDPDGIEPESGRAAWDDVGDYNGLVDVGAHDQFGSTTAIANLSQYTVRVTVSQSSALGGLAASAVRRIDVTVTDPTGIQVALSGYRTNY
jgi:MSHA pilin protein MshD